MRRIQRGSLTQGTLEELAGLTRDVVNSANPKTTAQEKWRGKPKPAFAEVRRVLESMAPGRSRCMYCEDSQGTDIEHFWPKAHFPERAFDWLNYLLACGHCNSNLKRSQFPRDAAGGPLLVDPTSEDPAEQLLFLPSSGEFTPIGPKGDDTIRVFGLNDSASPRRLPHGRKQALIGLKALLQAYDAAVASADTGRAADIKGVVQDYPFSAVTHWLVATAAKPAADKVLGDALVSLLKAHQVSSWL